MGQIQPLDLRYTITTDYAVTVLAHAPEGWEEGLIKWVRNEKYWGLFRSFSVPMKFALDGKAALAEAYANQGAEARAEVKIERCDPDTWTYVDYYNAVVDFSNIKWGYDFIECNLIEGGISQVIKAKEGVMYNLRKAPYNAEIPIVEIGIANLSTSVFKAATFRACLEALLHQMYGAVVPVYSELLDDLDAANQTLYITNGRGIRVNDHNLDSLTTSLWDMFQFLNARHCCGMGVEVIDGVDTVVIDYREYFMQNSEIVATVPNGMEIEIAPASQFMANKIKYGWATWQPDEVPAAYQDNRFAKECEATIPTKTVSRDIEAVSKYYTDGELIKYLYSLGGPSSDDNSMDNEIFGLHVNYAPYSEADYIMHPGSCNGVPVALNTYFAPKRCLLRWKVFIESITAGITETTSLPYVVPTLPKGNTGVYTTCADLIPLQVNEDDTVILTGASNMFMPYIFKLKVAGTVDIADIFEGNHNGYITFTYGAVTLKGYIMEVSANPTRRKELEFTLLAHKDTNLTTLLT